MDSRVRVKGEAVNRLFVDLQDALELKRRAVPHPDGPIFGSAWLSIHSACWPL